MMQVQNIFPTPLFSEMASPEQVVRWTAIARKLLPDDGFLRSYQSHRPWCTEDDIHTRREWSEFSKFILDMAGHSLDAWGVLRQDHFISGMWVNAQYQQSNQQAHTHPNSILSGCFYLQVPEHSQYIHYYDPRPAAGVWSLRKSIVDDHFAIQPVSGLSLMWPSWLQHSTQSTTTVQLTEPRITVSWNIMIKDRIDGHSSKLDLYV